MLKKLLATLPLFALLACGFQVIYRDEGEIVSHAHELASIRIQKDRTRLSQELRNGLYDLFNPDYIKSEPKYFLVLNIKQSSTSTFTTSTGASGRNKVILEVTYELKNLSTAQRISTGSTSVNDNYDVTTNRYGTFVADEYVQHNLTKIAAQNIRNSLVNDLIEIRKKCDKKTEVVEKDFVCPLDAKLSDQTLKKK